MVCKGHSNGVAQATVKLTISGEQEWGGTVSVFGRRADGAGKWGDISLIALTIVRAASAPRSRLALTLMNRQTKCTVPLVLFATLTRAQDAKRDGSAHFMLSCFQDEIILLLSLPTEG